VRLIVVKARWKNTFCLRNAVGVAIFVENPFKMFSSPAGAATMCGKELIVLPPLRGFMKFNGVGVLQIFRP
jgi:hypothetical protein